MLLGGRQNHHEDSAEVPAGMTARKADTVAEEIAAVENGGQ